MVRDMLSAMARSPEGRALLAFKEANNLGATWDNPIENGVTARFFGEVLSNGNPATTLLSQNQLNDEMLVVLRSPHGECVQNVNTLLAFACAYIADQYEKVGRSLPPIVTSPILPSVGITSSP